MTMCSRMSDNEALRVCVCVEERIYGGHVVPSTSYVTFV